MAAKEMVGDLLKYFGSMVVKVKVFGSMVQLTKKRSNVII